MVFKEQWSDTETRNIPLAIDGASVRLNYIL
jgi:hypothetical protein